MACAKRAAAAPQPAASTIAVDGPGGQVLGEAGERAAQGRRHGQARSQAGVEGAEERAVLEVQERADRGLARAPAGDEPAEQLGVVVVDVEGALVQRLLREPHGRGEAPGERAAEGCECGRRPCCGEL